MTTHATRHAALAAVVLVTAAAATPAAAGEAEARDLRSQVPVNAYAAIPPMCYTRTVDAAGAVHNPCYACHTASATPNFVDDGDLQTLYDFPPSALTNHWTNLFVDRRPQIAAIADDAILTYAREDNYLGADGEPELAARLASPPAGWDINGDGAWSGYVPDIYFDFDDAGYDLNAAGERTGWRAYGYVPLPGSFWPSNGSADDVAIRLPAAFRQAGDGTVDWSVYATNLAIVEALAKREDVAISATDETALGVDLDRDGTLGVATQVTFAFDPRNGVTMSYVGKAKDALAEGRLHLAAGLFPEGTEFVHSLRYLDIDPDGNVLPAARVKELRYARKLGWRTYMSLLEQAMNELREENDYPDRPERFFGDVESGIATGRGWRMQGFIEDAGGALRPQTYEESLTCAGCHAGTGRAVDNTFSYPRKVDHPDGGWFHWDAKRPLGSLPDAPGPDGVGEYRTYLIRNGAGDEFRANDEAIARFFPDGQADEAAIAALETMVAGLTTPSPARAIALNKAYKLIVEEQSYDKGRNPVIAPMDATVWRDIPEGTETGIVDAVN